MLLGDFFYWNICALAFAKSRLIVTNYVTLLSVDKFSALDKQQLFGSPFKLAQKNSRLGSYLDHFSLLSLAVLDWKFFLIYLHNDMSFSWRFELRQQII